MASWITPLQTTSLHGHRHPDLHEGKGKKVAEARFKEALHSHDALRSYLATSRLPST